MMQRSKLALTTSTGVLTYNRSFSVIPRLRISCEFSRTKPEILSPAIESFYFSNLPPGKSFSTVKVLLHSHDDGVPGTIPVTFINRDSTKVETLGREGELALRLAQRYDIPMEGACEASLACTTCHCYVETHAELLPEATETEEDLLDQAPFLEMNSRLGCQIELTQELAGITLRLPRATKNFYVDGHVPQPH